MRFLLLCFFLCSLSACDSLSGNQKTTQEETKPVSSEQKRKMPVTTERNIPFFEASGFEPMWSLKLTIAQDGSYPLTFVTITEELSGTLKKVSEHTYEGMVKGRNSEKPFALPLQTSHAHVKMVQKPRRLQ